MNVKMTSEDIRKMSREEIRAAYEELPVSNISDALDHLGIQRRIITGLIPASYTQPRMAGWAYTVRQCERHPDAGDAFLLTKHGGIIDHVAEPGDVMVIELGGRVDACSGGTMLAMRGQIRGLKGFVVDGGYRDPRETIELNFPVFLKGWTPAKSGPHLETVETKGPVMIDGVQIRQGDLVVGDDNGLVVVAPKDIYDVYEETRDIYLFEEKTTEGIRNGLSMPEAKKIARAYVDELLGKNK